MAQVFQSFIGGMEAGEDARTARERRNALDIAGQAYSAGDDAAAENALMRAGLYQEAAQNSALAEARRSRATRQSISQAMTGAGADATPQARAEAGAQAAMESGDTDQWAQFTQYANTLGAQERQVQGERAQWLGSAAASLLNVPAEQRAERARALLAASPYANDQHIAQMIDDTPELSDEALTSAAQNSMSAADILAGRERQERYGVEDQRWRQQFGLQREALEAQQASRMLTPEEAQEMGFRPGSVVAVDRRGMPRVLQDSLGFTDGEQNAANFANRMRGAESILTNLEAGGVDPAQVYARGGTSREARSYRQAQREYLAAILRKDTGAAVTDQEFAFYTPMYFPVPGDTPAQIEQKRQSRQRAFQGVVAASGGAYHANFLGGAGTGLMEEALQGTAYELDGAAPAAATPGATPAGRGPSVGAVVNGYRFKGGNPNDRNSWERVATVGEQSRTLSGGVLR